MNDTKSAKKHCDDHAGALPGGASLASARVPAQQSSLPQYEIDTALARGTLFPGLDLPFRNIVNQDAADVPLAELMAIDFACTDLSLYLDTHPNDTEAFAAYRDILKLSEEGRARYAMLYGPISKEDLATAEKYTWLKSPWPWEDNRGKEV